MNLRCPKCGGLVTFSGDLAGEVVECPHCGRDVLMPRSMAIRGELLPPATPSPVVVVSTQQHNRRLPSHGWFSRSFSATMGVVVALGFVALFGLVALFGAGVFLVGLSLEKHPTVDTLTPYAKRFAMQELSKYNITRLNDETFAARDGDFVALSGQALDNGGIMHKVFIKWTVAKFGKETRWQVEGILIDDEAVFVRE